MLAPLIGLAGLAACTPADRPPAARADWPTYGHDKGGQRYSPAAQITPANVADLRVAWTYHMKPAEEAEEDIAGADAEHAADAGPQPRSARAGNPFRQRQTGDFAGSEVTPLVVNGRMYLTTPYSQVIALNPQTGEEIWKFDVPNSGRPSSRGVEYWAGDANSPASIIFGTREGLLIALQAGDGTPVRGFGQDGILDLKTDDVMNGMPNARYGMTSPPLVFDDLVLTGSAVGEFPAKGASGAVRAWDVRTGKLKWIFDPLPDPGEPGYETWEEGSSEGRSGVNVWGFMTVDVEREIAYLPFGAPTWDRYGGDRKGANLFSSSLVAVNARNGQYLWHFQAVHHDIWDYDLEAPPTLFDITKDGKTIPAVALVSKNALLFLLDRTSGEPIYPVEQRPVPASDTPGEEAWPTQPFPVKPAPLARNSFAIEDIATVTPELKAYCEDFVLSNDMQFGGPYIPFGYEKHTILFPGFQGGANWGGASFNPELSYLFVNTSDMGQVYSLVDGPNSPLGITGGSISSRFYQQDTRLMCQQPPWGQLTAVDVSTGEIAWQTRLGVSDILPADLQKTGRPNVGGSIATAGGLVFIGATDDARFRAFDARTGEELWTVKLDAAAHATPITYVAANDKQYVVTIATGGSFLFSPSTSDSVVAFSLP